MRSIKLLASNLLMLSRMSGILTIIIIITHNHLLHLPKLAHLAPKVLIKRIKMHLQLLRIQLGLWIIGRILVQVREEDGLRVRRLDVLARAAVAVAAGADLVVEGAVDFVLLGAEDGGEVVGHCVLGALYPTIEVVFRWWC